jgi:DHA1 family multidrug resistance protein-like MFS transporter
VAATWTLTEAERQRGLRVLLASTFFSWGGFFLVVPLISVHYVDQLGWAAASIGLVLAVRQFTQQGVTTLSGVLADRLGARGLIASGMLVRAAGFVLMARAESYGLLMLSAIVAALGGALFESPKAAAIAALMTEVDRPRYFALSGVVSGLGVTIGTQTGALLLRVDFAAVSLAGAGCFFLLFWLILLLLPPVRVAHETGSLGRGLRLALSDRPFVTFQVVMMG